MWPKPYLFFTSEEACVFYNQNALTLAIRTMVVPIRILIRTTVVPIRILIRTTGITNTLC